MSMQLPVGSLLIMSPDMQRVVSVLAPHPMGQNVYVPITPTTNAQQDPVVEVSAREEEAAEALLGLSAPRTRKKRGRGGGQWSDEARKKRNATLRATLAAKQARGE